jgi:hypothetical protein
MRSVKRFSVKCLGTLSFLLVLLTLATGPVMAAQDAGICPNDRINKSNFCTAKDVQLAVGGTGVATGLTCFPGGTVDVALAATLTVRNGLRYDMGVWVSTDGKPLDVRGGTNGAPDDGGAQSCEVLPLPSRPITADSSAIVMIDNFDSATTPYDCYDSSAGANINTSTAFALTSTRDSIISGLVDSNNDGAINTGPNGDDTTTLPVFGAQILLGKVDINGDGLIDAINDTGIWNGYAVDTGVIDVDGDGTPGGDSEQSFNDLATLLCVAGPNGGVPLETLVSWGVDASNLCLPTDPDTYILEQSKCATNSDEANVDIVGRVTVVKNAPASLGGESFQFSYSNDAPTQADTDDPDLIPNISVGTPFSLLDTGRAEIYAVIGNRDGVGGAFIDATVVITENNLPAGWQLDSISCTGDDLVAVTSNVIPEDPSTYVATVTLRYNEADLNASQDDVECTFNNVPTGSITLIKNVINLDGGNALPDAFKLTVDGDPVLSNQSNIFPAGTDLPINETLLDGYSFVDITGDGCPLALGGTVNLDPGENITCTITNEYSAKLTLVKTASPLTYSAVGETISYSYDLTNNGNISLYPPYTVIDDKATVTCPATPASLAPLATVACTASYTIVQGDLDAGSVVNLATGTAQDAVADGSPVNSNQDSQTVTATATPDLTLVKTATPTTYDTVGDVIGYSYVLTNNGNVSLHPPYTVADDKATVTCPAIPDPLVPLATVTCTASYTIVQADLDAGSVVNLATGTAQDAVADGSPVNSNEGTVTVTAIADLIILFDKSGTLNDDDGRPGVSVGDTISYVFTVTNTGNVTLTNVIVTDSLITVIGGPLLSLAPSAVDASTFTGSYTLTQEDIDAGEFTNTATVSSTEGATDQDSDTQILFVPVAAIPVLVPVPVNSTLALLLLSLMLLATGWYFRPAAVRKF